MSDNGFIYLDRKFFDHSMWREKRVFSRQEAWLDLIQLARWKKEAHNVAIKDKLITCNRGQLVRSMVTLADRWGWSKSKVKRVLDVFKERGMIRIENETVTTRITLCNYETYQTKDSDSETQAKRKRNASETQVDTEEEGKERKKENTNKKSGAGIHPLHLRLLLIFQKTISDKPRPSAEMAAWKKIKGHVTESDVEKLEAFYALPKNSERSDGTWSRKMAATQLMNQFTTQLELANEHKSSPQRRQPSRPATPAPRQWKEAMRHKLRDAPVKLAAWIKSEPDERWESLRETEKLELTQIINTELEF